MKILMKEYSI